MSEDEARDTLGELKRFAPPPAMDQPISVMFFVDLSCSMKKTDITGREGLRRIDAVIEVLKRFVTQQMAAGAVMDVYTLVTFSLSTYQVRFHRQRAAEAVSKLTCDTFEPFGAVAYSEIIVAMEALAVRGQACLVIFLSDGVTACLKNNVLPDFQRAVMGNPHVILHCIGFGDSDFSILQQLAQIGRGSFSRASMDIDNLVNTFTSLSKTFTQTRNTAHSQERVAPRTPRTVVFDSARRFNSEKGVVFRKHGARTGERCTYKPDPSGLMGLKRASTKACVLRLHKNPFMQGGMRLVYRCRDEGIPKEMVAKFSRFEEDDNSWDFIAMFIKNTAQTRELIQQFHDAYSSARSKRGWHPYPRRLVSCIQAWEYYLPRTEVYPELNFVAEAFLHGSEKGFLKWVNNRGEILIPSSSSDFSMAAEAFAHFSLDASGGKLMVSDLQGVLKPGKGNCKRIHLTDPQILSWDQSFGAADLGPTAMQTFRSLHVCNALCKKLQLSSLSWTRSALCNVRQRPTLPVMPPTPSEPFERERGRSPTRRHVESTERRSDDMETLKATNLLLSDDGSKAKRLLFVGEYTHLFTVAAAKFVQLRLQLPNLKLEWHSTELCWPRLESMRAELQQSLDYLTPLGVTAIDKVDATALDLWRLRRLAGAIWVWAPSSYYCI